MVLVVSLLGSCFRFDRYSLRCAFESGSTWVWWGPSLHPLISAFLGASWLDCKVLRSPFHCGFAPIGRIRVTPPSPPVPSASSTTARALWRAGAGNVDRHLAPVELTPVVFSNRVICIAIIREGDKSKASATPRVRVKGHVNVRQISKLLKVIAQVGLVGLR